MQNNLLIEKQVCTREQAEAFAAIFKKEGIEPPGSLWVWLRSAKFGGSLYKSIPMLRENYRRLGMSERSYAAYTGDELGVLMKNAGSHIIPLLVKDKASHAIEYLGEGLFKPEDFNY